MRSGRPLRFLLLIVGGWTGVRTMALWQAVLPPGTPLPLPLIAAARASERLDPAPWLREAIGRADVLPWRVAAFAPAPPARLAAAPALHPTGGATGVALALAALVRFGPSVPVPRQDGGAILPPLRPAPIAPGRSRLAGSAWLIGRGNGDGTTTGSALGGQLGASQAGARLTYTLGSARRVALSARVATPLRGAGREAAFGIDWQPTRAPVHLIAEQRVSLDGGRGGPTLLAVGGIDPTPVAAGFRLEAYAQAGAIVRTDTGDVEGFGDGAARLTRPVATLGRLRLDLGAGAWGGVQRGARRLDVGPTLGLVAPVGRRAVRLTLDWRERVAGAARPGSGPALSLGSDF